LKYIGIAFCSLKAAAKFVCSKKYECGFGHLVPWGDPRRGAHAPLGRFNEGIFKGEEIEIFPLENAFCLLFGVHQKVGLRSKVQIY